MFLTPETAAKTINVHTNTIRKAVRSGELKAYRPATSPRGRISITEADLATFQESRG